MRIGVQRGWSCVCVPGDCRYPPRQLGNVRRGRNGTTVALMAGLLGSACRLVFVVAANSASLQPRSTATQSSIPPTDQSVARRLRSGGSTAQLIALTGYGRGEDVQRAKAEGFDLHMVKPVDIPVLLRRLAV